MKLIDYIVTGSNKPEGELYNILFDIVNLICKKPKSPLVKLEDYTFLNGHLYCKVTSEDGFVSTCGIPNEYLHSDDPRKLAALMSLEKRKEVLVRKHQKTYDLLLSQNDELVDIYENIAKLKNMI